MLFIKLTVADHHRPAARSSTGTVKNSLAKSTVQPLENILWVTNLGLQHPEKSAAQPISEQLCPQYLWTQWGEAA